MILILGTGLLRKRVLNRERTMTLQGMILRRSITNAAARPSPCPPNRLSLAAQLWLACEWQTDSDRKSLADSVCMTVLSNSHSSLVKLVSPLSKQSAEFLSIASIKLGSNLENTTFDLFVWDDFVSWLISQNTRTICEILRLVNSVSVLWSAAWTENQSAMSNERPKISLKLENLCRPVPMSLKYH